MLMQNKFTKRDKIINKPQTGDSCSCKSSEWLWGNGKNYCPYCQKPIRV